MTDREIVERLAREVMGFTLREWITSSTEGVPSLLTVSETGRG